MPHTYTATSGAIADDISAIVETLATASGFADGDAMIQKMFDEQVVAAVLQQVNAAALAKVEELGAIAAYQKLTAE